MRTTKGLQELIEWQDVVYIHLLGEARQVAEFSLQQGQVRPQEGHHEGPEREVGHVLQGMVELLYRYAAALEQVNSCVISITTSSYI